MVLGVFASEAPTLLAMTAKEAFFNNLLGVLLSSF